jgi:hypothetical protein
MYNELIAYLREHAHKLVKLARRESDAEIASELEGLAVELLQRASDLERDTRF